MDEVYESLQLRYRNLHVTQCQLSDDASVKYLHMWPKPDTTAWRSGHLLPSLHAIITSLTSKEEEFYLSVYSHFGKRLVHQEVSKYVLLSKKKISLLEYMHQGKTCRGLGASQLADVKKEPLGVVMNKWLIKQASEEDLCENHIVT